jgi:hypothetical protein
MKKIKIFGERNTGTNYLRKLIELNIKVVIVKDYIPKIPVLRKSELFHALYFKYTKKSDLGWKHTLIDIDFIEKQLKMNKDLNVILIVKNPYSFLLSLHKRPYHNKKKKKLTFNKFLQDGWKTLKRENMSKEVLIPIELWNKKIKASIELFEKNRDRVVIIKYENLVADPEGVLLSVSNHIGLELINQEFTNHSTSTKNDNKSYTDYSEYYLNEKWRKNLSPEDISLINDNLDMKLLSYLGYNIIDG